MEKLLDCLQLKLCKELSEEQKLFLSIFNRYRIESNLEKERCTDLISSYLFDCLYEESIKSDFSDYKSPILICVIKNERIRIKQFFEHYRRMGIFQFAIIDNNSTDGTKQFCSMQGDVNLFSVKTNYSSARRVGWINQILSKYGRNRWYIIVDSDELLDFVGSEMCSINDVIYKMEAKNIKRVLGIQVDFYSKIALFGMEGDNIEWDSCSYFDKDSYIEQNNKKCVWFVGGPRKRLLNTYSLLTKYPVFYYDNDTINISSHYLYPFNENFRSQCFICIKHYEFLNQKDYEKMKDIINKKNYASNSREYVEMFKRLKNTERKNFYDKKASVKYITSNNLLQIEYIKDWKK